MWGISTPLSIRKVYPKLAKLDPWCQSSDTNNFPLRWPEAVSVRCYRFGLCYSVNVWTPRAYCINIKNLEITLDWLIQWLFGWLVEWILHSLGAKIPIMVMVVIIYQLFLSCNCIVWNVLEEREGLHWQGSVCRRAQRDPQVYREGLLGGIDSTTQRFLMVSVSSYEFRRVPQSAGEDLGTPEGGMLL